MKWSRLLLIFCALPALLFGAALRMPFGLLPGTLPAVAEPGNSRATTATRESAKAKPDIYGNDVNPAVATYQIDTAGAIYELHSPDTAVATLGPPQM